MALLLALPRRMGARLVAAAMLRHEPILLIAAIAGAENIAIPFDNIHRGPECVHVGTRTQTDEWFVALMLNRVAMIHTGDRLATFLPESARASLKRSQALQPWDMRPFSRNGDLHVHS